MVFDSLAIPVTIPKVFTRFGARALSGAVLEHCPGTVEHCVAMQTPAA